MFQVMGRVLAAIVMFAALGAPAVGQTGQSAPYTEPKAAGWSTNPVVPSNSQKGYYVPRVVPYPVGQPVAVSGYYDRYGRYVAPTFRSLPSTSSSGSGGGHGGHGGHR